MSSIHQLVHLLSGTPGLTTRITPGTATRFMQLATIVRPSILLAQTPSWDPRCAPASAYLPHNVSVFLAMRLEISQDDVLDLWDALRDEVWEDYAQSELDSEGMEDVNKGGYGNDMNTDMVPAAVATVEPHIRMHDETAQACSLCELMLYPPIMRCNSTNCSKHNLLCMKESPKTVTVFTLSSGVCDGFAVQLYCVDCNTTYYPNYSVQSDERTYYASHPEHIQVADHTYIETRVINLFTTLSLLSWTSATNAAHVYHHSLSQLPVALQDEAKYQLRTEHVWDGFVIHALIKDTLRARSILTLPQRGDQKDRLSAAMAARNDQIRCGGTPEYAHFCTKCVRPFKDPDSITRYVDCIVTDGIEIGRPCCGVRHCAEPLDSVHHRFCHLHRHELKRCAVDSCSDAIEAGYKTCPAHRPVEDHHKIIGKAVFTLRGRAVRSEGLEHPPNISVADPSEDITVTMAPPDCSSAIQGAPALPPLACPQRTLDGDQRVTARFGRRRTHNEQLILRPCGVILWRETFYGSETTPQVVDMLRKTFLVPGSLPRYMWYDNNCGLWKHLNATPGETLHRQIGLPVDVFHWTCKHKKTDVACSVHCNPYRFKELLDDDGKWYFNSSAAEQTNVWAGGYGNIIREMGAVKCDFFLDEMIVLRNEMTCAKLERTGCRPGHRPGLRFGNVSC